MKKQINKIDEAGAGEEKDEEKKYPSKFLFF